MGKDYEYPDDMHTNVDDDFTGGHGFCGCAEHWAQLFKHFNLHLAVELLVFIVVILDGCVLSIEMYDVYHALPFEVALPQVALAVVIALALLVMVELYFNITHGFDFVGVLQTTELILLFGSAFFVINELVFVSNFNAYCAAKASKDGRRLAGACPSADGDGGGHRRLAGGVPGVYGFIDGFDPLVGEMIIVILGAIRLVIVAYNLLYTFVLLSTSPPIDKQHHDDHH